MNASQQLRMEIAGLGYSTIVNNYVFSDVFSTSAPDRTVPLAAFTHTPPSYRNAALAVIEIAEGTGSEVTPDYRALGAPLLFVVEGQRVTVWEVRPNGRPTIHGRTTLDQVGSLFAVNRDVWSPRRIHNAKSFGLLNKSYQLDFVDVGLLSAIEGEVHDKLNQLLNETLAETVRLRVIHPGHQGDDRLIFRTVFRLLAAKVLQDRGHELVSVWDSANIDSVLKGISGYYKLPALPGERGSFKNTIFDAAWSRLRAGISFRNISSDDLAFVYENTLVTEETRKYFGVHSTPKPVAEYIVSRLHLQPEDALTTKIYEPFAGAGVFMVAALRCLRDLLPIGMGEVDRHKVLINLISGDEIEPFAAEVAILSLILADYPNENGWNVSTIDLFLNYTIAERVKYASVVLCNPPFEPFTKSDKLRYREAAAISSRKPTVALDAILDARPSALGFVLPEPFIDGANYNAQRQRIERLYKDIEIVSLPDRVFKASVIRSSLLIAQEPRATDETITSVRSTVVSAHDRERFLKSGEVSDTRVRMRPLDSFPGRLWIDELDELWEALSALPSLRTVAEVHRGIEWHGDQSGAASSTATHGSHLGIQSGDAIRAFSHSQPVFLDLRQERLRFPGSKLDWKSPKLLANAARISRGHWCFAAAIDRSGLIASQQLFGIWAVSTKPGPSLESLCALLNGPVAVAYIASHSPPDRIRVETVNSVPVPSKFPNEIESLVSQYMRLLGERSALFSPNFVERANRALYEIDAAVLECYNLPPRLERKVLEYFRGENRPTLHDWMHWFPPDFQAYLPLHRYLSDEFRIATSGWALSAFKPLPDEEAQALRDYLD